jgi:hypothetical protein
MSFSLGAAEDGDRAIADGFGDEGVAVGTCSGKGSEQLARLDPAAVEGEAADRDIRQLKDGFARRRDACGEAPGFLSE